MKKLFSKNYKGFVSGVIITLLILVLSNLNYVGYLFYYQLISTQFDGEIDKTVVQNSIMEGITAGLGDPHSEFMTKEETEKFKQSISTSYSGSIGVLYQADEKGAKVTNMLKNSPSYESGIYPGDIITSINGVKVDESNNDDIKALLKPDIENKVETLRPSTGKTETINIKAADYSTESVMYKMIDDKTGYIYIESFSNTTSEEFEKALFEIEKNNIDKLIIDVRDNGGGEVSAVNAIANQIIYSEDPYLYMKHNNKVTNSYTSSLETKKPYQIVGIQNENSASASEILMAAIKEANDEEIVGVKSYGKGSAQKQFEYTQDESYKITVEHWFTPDDNTIEKEGVAPTKEVLDKSFISVEPILLEKTLKQGDVTFQVGQVNTYLYYLGYDTVKYSTEYSQKTANAITDFQEKNNIAVTGIVNSQTAYELYLLAKDSVINPNFDPYIKVAMEV